MTKLNLLKIDCHRENAEEAITQLRKKLSPEGNIVSERGKQRTIEIFGQPLSVQQVVERICNDVKEKGLDALLDYSKRIDNADVTPEQLRVSTEELTAAHNQVDPEFLACIRRIRENILEFQQAILHQDVRISRPSGSYLQQRYIPLRRIGICVPGGAAAYPSTVLMTAIPAQAAGVAEIAVVAPPTKFGSYNTDLLATCHELGISEVYRAGGAQAVAALAYGVQGIPAVDKIVGPGNLFVALAKKTVYGEVDIDSIAGPSEVIVLADSQANPQHIAAELIAQAEHSPGCSLLITWDAQLIDKISVAIEEQLATLERGDLAAQSLQEYGALILAKDRSQAIELTNDFAPEHLHIDTETPEAIAEEITTAGAAFLGSYSPVALGDYAAGPSHVLPTSGTARWASGLTSNDFLRSGSVIHYTQDALKGVLKDIQIMANKEGLTAHRASVEIRLEE